HGQLREFVCALNQLYQQELALSELDTEQEGFSWIDCHDVEHSVISFIRWGKEKQDSLIFICNFTPMPQYGYRLGIPFPGEYYEVLNSDDTRFGGSGLTNTQSMPSGPVPWHTHAQSILLTLSPLSTIILKWRSPGGNGKDNI
ncbi:MAG TPA: alpha amylase C-terminal domain-containing protein, partial [Ktedonobacteraceae bacterium]